MVLSTRVRGEGRPVVLLPWFGLDQAVMAAAFEPVFSTATGWRRVYVDLPGTGASPPVAPDSDVVLDAVRETIEAAVGAAPYLLAGCSYGGYLAAGLARRAPADVAGLLLVCTGVRIGPDERNLSGVRTSDPEPQWLTDVPAELHGHFDRGIGHQTRAVARRTAEAFGLNGPTDDGYLETLRSTGYRLSDEDSPHTFDGNVTVLAGVQDRIVGHRDQLETLARYGHGSFVALGDAGHYLPFEQPERFRSLTLDWLEQCASAPSGDTTSDSR